MPYQKYQQAPIVFRFQSFTMRHNSVIGVTALIHLLYINYTVIPILYSALNFALYIPPRTYPAL